MLTYYSPKLCRHIRLKPKCDSFEYNAYSYEQAKADYSQHVATSNCKVSVATTTFYTLDHKVRSPNTGTAPDISLHLIIGNFKGDHGPPVEK